MVNDMDIDAQIIEYINYVEIERGLSKNTVDGYYRDLVAFFEYVKKTYKKIEKKDITNYIMYISKDKNTKTVNRHIVSIRNYFKYLSRNGLISDNPCDDIVGLKIPKKVPHVLNEDEINKLLDTTDKVSYTLDLNLNKNNNKWEIEPLTNEQLTKLHGTYEY